MTNPNTTPTTKNVSASEEASSYAVVADAIGIYRSGLSHSDAMRLAEELQRDGKLVSVLHVTPHGCYEVDRYPLR